MAILENLLGDIEKRRNIKIPFCFLNNNGYRALDDALDSGNPNRVYGFYKRFGEYYSTEPLKALTIELKKRRQVSKSDKELIRQLATVKNRDIGFVLEISGSLHYL